MCLKMLKKGRIFHSISNWLLDIRVLLLFDILVIITIIYFFHTMNF